MRIEASDLTEDERNKLIEAVLDFQDCSQETNLFDRDGDRAVIECETLDLIQSILMGPYMRLRKAYNIQINKGRVHPVFANVLAPFASSHASDNEPRTGHTGPNHCADPRR